MRSKTDPVGVAPQYFSADRVKRTCPDIFRSIFNFSRNPFFKLSGGFIRECNGKNLPRHCARNAENTVRNIIRRAVQIIFPAFYHIVSDFGDKIAVIGVPEFHNIRYPVDQNSCFAASRSGKYKDRSFDRGYSLELHIVHTAEIFFYDFLS